MPKTEDSEFELVLGNRQLLTVFFIVVVLFGIFFAMGFIVGRNSAPHPAISGLSGSKPGDTAAAQPAPPPVVPKETEPAKTEEPAEEPASGTHAATASGQEPQRTETKPAAPSAPPEPQPPAGKPAPEPQPAAPPVTAAVEFSASSMYLQVVATAKADAELMVDVLRKRGFPALAAPAPDGRLYRVLVGPFSDREKLSKTKDSLEAAGFKSIVRK